MTRTAVVLFTRDLRVHDHPALAAARSECDRVVPLRRWLPEPASLPAARIHEPTPEQRRALGYIDPIRGEERAA